MTTPSLPRETPAGTPSEQIMKLVQAYADEEVAFATMPGWASQDSAERQDEACLTAKQAVEDALRAYASACVAADRAAVQAALASALNWMMTQFGMDEDEWSKPTFDKARSALDAYHQGRASPAHAAPELPPRTPEQKARDLEYVARLRDSLPTDDQFAIDTAEDIRIEDERINRARR